MRIEMTLAKLSQSHLVLTLLNQVTIDLLEKGIRQWAYPWKITAIKKDIGLHRVYLVTGNKGVIGTFFIGSTQKIELLQVSEKALYLSQMAILPEFQGLDYGRSILNFCQDLGKKANLTVYLDCPSENQPLKHFYLEHNCDYIGEFKTQGYRASGFKLSD